MDKYRKAVVELCAAIELAKLTEVEGGFKLESFVVDANDWRILKKLVDSIKASFNHSMQFHYEQHLARERDFRGIITQAEPQKEGDQ